MKRRSFLASVAAFLFGAKALSPEGDVYQSNLEDADEGATEYRIDWENGEWQRVQGRNVVESGMQKIRPRGSS